VDADAAAQLDPSYAFHAPLGCNRRSTATPAGTTRLVGVVGAAVVVVGAVVVGAVDVGAVVAGTVVAGTVVVGAVVAGTVVVGAVVAGTVVVGAVVAGTVLVGTVVVGTATPVDEVTVNALGEVTTGSYPTFVVRLRFSRMMTRTVGFGVRPIAGRVAEVVDP
jgi:hypothetical protein